MIHNIPNWLIFGVNIHLDNVKYSWLGFCLLKLLLKETKFRISWIGINTCVFLTKSNVKKKNFFEITLIILNNLIS